ncbi:MAG: acyl-CoA dehydrogenase family protein [Burkholderiales bacterium]
MTDANDSPVAGLLESVRELGPSIAAAADEIERIRDIPDALFDRLIERDLFRLLLPRDYGGAEIDPLRYVRILEEVAKSDASTAWCLGQNNVCSMVAAYLEPATAMEIFDSPRAILAWGPGPGAARVTPGGYLLSGNFDFASGSRHASWLGAHVPVIETDGSRRTAADGSARLHTLLFPRAEAQLRDNWRVLGLRGTGSDSYSVAGVQVPESRTLVRDASAQLRQKGPLYAFSQSHLYASGFAAVALGIGQACFDAFVSTIRDTVPRGASRSRGANNVVQSEVAQAEARLRSSRMFLFGSLDEIWSGVMRSGAMTNEQRLTIRLATTWAIQQAREAVTALYMAAGALAIFESQPFERRFRDIHTLSQQMQGHAAHFETVGQMRMGMKLERSLFTF